MSPISSTTQFVSARCKASFAVFFFFAMVLRGGLALAQSTGPVHGSVIGAPIDSAPPSRSPAPAPPPGFTNILATGVPDAGNSAIGSPISAGDTAGFDKLSAFPFTNSDDMIMGTGDVAANSRAVADQIPASVKALDAKTVSITGFMLPTKVDDGNATEFLLLKNRSMCCYGLTPNLNEYVAVRISGHGIKPVMDRLVTVFGTLHVGEIRQNRLLIGLYQMDATKVDVSDDQ
jgi:hypothetical protein